MQPRDMRKTPVNAPGMTKTKKAKTRRPSKERPVIRDEAAVLTRALRPTLTRRKAEFSAAHKDGIAALKRGDYDAVRDALVRERKVIDATGASLQQARKRHK
jgi:hypothetical protein